VNVAVARHDASGAETHTVARGGPASAPLRGPCPHVARIAFDLLSTVGGTAIAVASLTGIEFWDLADITAPRMVHAMMLPGVRYPDAYMRVVMSISWQAPYVYVGGSDNGVFVVDATDPAAPRLVTQFTPEPNFRVGNVHAIGNLRIIIGSENTRAALYDISLPDAPRPHAGGAFKVYAGLDARGRERLSSTRATTRTRSGDFSPDARRRCALRRRADRRAFLAVVDGARERSGEGATAQPREDGRGRVSRAAGTLAPRCERPLGAVLIDVFLATLYL